MASVVALAGATVFAVPAFAAPPLAPTPSLTSAVGAQTVTVSWPAVSPASGSTISYQGGLTDGADAVPDDSLSSETATSFSAPAPSSGGGYFRVRSISQTADGSVASDYATLPLDGRPLTQAPVAPVPSGSVAPVPISRPATPRIAPLVPEVTKRPPVVSVVSPVEPGGSIQWQVDRGPTTTGTTVDLRGVAVGNHRLRVWSVDAAGVRSQPAIFDFVRVGPATSRPPKVTGAGHPVPTPGTLPIIPSVPYPKVPQATTGTPGSSPGASGARGPTVGTNGGGTTGGGPGGVITPTVGTNRGAGPNGAKSPGTTTGPTTVVPTTRNPTTPGPTPGPTPINPTTTGPTTGPKVPDPTTTGPTTTTPVPPITVNGKPGSTPKPSSGERYSRIATWALIGVTVLAGLLTLLMRIRFMRALLPGLNRYRYELATLTAAGSIIVAIILALRRA